MTFKPMTALEKIRLQEQQIGDLTNRCEKLSQKAAQQKKQIGALQNQCDLAERQSRSLTLELQSARRQIVGLQSLTRPDAGGAK